MKHPVPRIQLGDAQPLASGRYRYVFQHPEHGDRLVKVFRANTPASPGVWYRPWGSGADNKTLRRELKEYASLKRKNLHDVTFIQRFFGEVETDKGPGIVVEKLRGKDGGLAPTVMQLVQRQGFTRELRNRMLELRDDVIAHNIIFTDVSGSNIVLAQDHHGERLVIIDGLGDRLWLPVNSMFAKVNHLNRRRHFQRAFEVLERSKPAAGG